MLTALCLHIFFLPPVRALQLGPDDCVENETISMNGVVLYALPGTVCIECSVGGEVANDTVFQIDTNNIDASIGRVVDGVLVVFDTESVFNTFSPTDVMCMSADLNAVHSAIMYLEGKSCYWESMYYDNIWELVST